MKSLLIALSAFAVACLAIPATAWVVEAAFRLLEGYPSTFALLVFAIVFSGLTMLGRKVFE
jgi:hypothetical protein